MNLSVRLDCNDVHVNKLFCIGTQEFTQQTKLRMKLWKLFVSTFLVRTFDKLSDWCISSGMACRLRARCRTMTSRQVPATSSCQSLYIRLWSID